MEYACTYVVYAWAYNTCKVHVRMDIMNVSKAEHAVWRYTHVRVRRMAHACTQCRNARKLVNIFYNIRLFHCYRTIGFRMRKMFRLPTFGLHRKKRFTSFPSPAGMSLTKLPLGRKNSVLTSLFPPRESLVVTSRLGTGNLRTFFYGVGTPHTLWWYDSF